MVLEREVMILQHAKFPRGNTTRHGRDRMVVGFTTTYAISTYHH